MRLAGTLTDVNRARRFQDYLLTLGIESSVRERPESTPESFGVWVMEEESLERAKTELERFLSNPDQREYVEAAREAVAVRTQEERERRDQEKREIEFSQRWRPPTWRDVPITLSLILLSICVEWILMSSGLEVGEFPTHPLGSLLITSPSVSSGETGFSIPWIPPEVARGEVWRLVSATILHFGLMHLAMNCFMLFWLGVAIEGRRGTSRFFVIALTVSFVSNYAQYLSAPSPSGGLSGLIFGLVGYAWMQSRYEPRHGIQVTPPFIAFCLFWMILCIVGRDDIANTAHVAGLISGVLIGVAPTLWRKLKPAAP